MKRPLRLLALLGLAWATTARAQVFEMGDDGRLHRIGEAAVAAADAAAAGQAPAAPERFRASLEDAAARHGLSPWLLDAVARTESGYDPEAVSQAGAIGLMQLMPATARELGVDPRDPAQNLDGGAAYLRSLLDRFDGSLDLALAAYNAGSAPVLRHQGIPPYRETRHYVARNLERLAAAAAAPPAPSSFSGGIP